MPADSMEQLPKSALLMVMQHLNVKDLLACRLVSKMFSGLALQPEVWRHRQLVDIDYCVCAVLHLAPCLRSLEYHSSGNYHTLAFISTRCAVAELQIILEGAEKHVTSEAALVLRNQEALGRLRRLQIRFFSRTSGADVLLKTVLAATSTLEDLEVVGGVPSATHRIGPVPHGPFLRRFSCSTCSLNPSAKPFVNIVLAGHAASLEEVNLGKSWKSPTSPSTTRLLAGISNLRKLRCKMLSKMEAVAACETLRDLHLWACPSQSTEGALKFLRRAHQLTKVTLEYWDDGDQARPYIGSELLEALASSGRSRVEWLSLACFALPPPVLGAALPLLPGLQQLEVLHAPVDDELLLTITPDKAPALRRLELAPGFWRACAHAWMHKDVIKMVLAANPSLHIQVQDAVGCAGECAVCARGCHREVRWDEEDRLGLFAHELDKCQSPEYHTTDPDWPCTWVQIPTTCA